MRIAYLYQYFNTPAMPGGSRAYEAATRLAARGHEVHVVTSTREPATGRGWVVTEAEGVRVHWYPVPYANDMHLIARMRSFAAFAVHAIPRTISLAPDLVFATSTPLTIAIPGIATSRWHGVPLVFEVRDLWPTVPIAMGALRNPLARHLALGLEWFSYHASTRVIALSPGMAEGVLRRGFPAERLTVIPNGCDLDRFDAAPAAAMAFRDAHPELGGGPIVLYAGTVGKVNGVEYLAHLADATREQVPAVRFVVIGSGSEEGAVRARASELGVLDRAFFMYPRMPKQDVAAAFAAASVVTSVVIDLPELEMNSANKFFDGLAAARPVAVNHGGWQADLLADHGAGFRLPRDVVKAAEVLAAWLNDPARLEVAGRAARRLAETRFARDLLADQLERVLLEAYATRRRR